MEFVGGVRGRGRRVLAGGIALALMAALTIVGVLLSNAQQDVRSAALHRFEERAQISAALTQSLFNSKVLISTDNLGTELAGSPAQLRRQLPNYLHPAQPHHSAEEGTYLAVMDSHLKVIASAGALPATFSDIHVDSHGLTLSAVQHTAAGPVVGLAVPFAVKSGERVLVEGVPLPLMRTLLDDYLKQLPNPDGAELHVVDVNGAMLAHTLPASPSDSSKGGDRVTASATVPSTSWKLQLTAPRARVLAGTDNLIWLPWVLIGALGLLALIGMVLYERLARSSARERQAYADLAANKRAQNTIVDALEEAVIVHHEDGRLDLLNPAAKLLMRTHSDAIGGLPEGWVRLHEDGTEATADEHPVRLAFQTGEPQQQVIGFLRPDGSRTWVEVRARPLGTFGEAGPRLVVTTSSDYSKRYEHNRRLSDLADRDPLTDLWNRRRFDRDLAGQIARCRETGESAALLIFDVDCFKQINDSFGHVRGDAVLQTIAAALAGRVRITDEAARIGGDEFAAMLLGVTEDEAQAMAVELAEALGRSAQALVPEIPVALSVGVAMLDAHTVDAASAMDEADQRMYAAKPRHRTAEAMLPSQRLSVASYGEDDRSGAAALR